MNSIREIQVSDVVFREDLYPRIKHDPATVQRYAEDLDVLPPIEVNQRNELIDGWHRWTAHKKANGATIRVQTTETESDVQLLELAIERNAAHGLQLSRDDKRKMALRIYSATPTENRAGKKESLATLLSVSKSTVADWLSDIDAQSKADRDEKIFSLWMSCRTQEEIAELAGITSQAVGLVLKESPDLEKLSKLSKQHALYDEPDFAPPLYNVWTWAKNAEGPKHYGNSHSQIVDRLLYLYTKPFDVVIDPFAGSGSTIDICQRRSRRHLASDRKPIPERAAELRTHDIKDGPLKPPRWQDVALVYLDPPYWVQAAGEYSEDAEDLANMPLQQFTDALAGLVKAYLSKLQEGAHVALIIQPTQWRAPERQFTDHVADLLRSIKAPVETRIQAPYGTEQCNAQMVNWAKENKQLLVLSREIIVWRVA
jgi:transcriptional regulator with XRE-family HTH domain